LKVIAEQNCRKQTDTKTQKTINTLEKTIMKSDSGREHVRRMIGIFWGMGMRENFEGTRNPSDRWMFPRRGRRLCKEDVGQMADHRHR